MDNNKTHNDSLVSCEEEARLQEHLKRHENINGFQDPFADLFEGDIPKIIQRRREAKGIETKPSEPKRADDLPEPKRKQDAREVAKELASVARGRYVYMPLRGWYWRQLWERDGKTIHGLWSKDHENLVVREGVANVLRRLRQSGVLERGIRTTTVISEMEPLLRFDGQFDKDSMVCGLPDGAVVDLQSGKRRLAMDDEFISRRLGVNPAKGDCPYWMRLLEHIAKDETEQTWLRRYLGYSLTGLTLEGKFLFLQGKANGGKTTFIETLKSIFGDASTGYGGGVNGDNLVSQRSDHLEWLARLEGLRLVLVSDIPSGTWNLGPLKAFVTGDTITARFMHKGSFEYLPSGKLIISGNHKPRIPKADTGFNRRLVLIPIDEIAKEKRDPFFKAKLAKELPQIAHWLIRAAYEWCERGLRDVPQRWLVAGREYQRSEDLIRQWFEACCEIEPDAWTENKRLVQSYNMFTNEHAKRITPIQEWLEQVLDDSRVYSERLISGYGHRGIRLKNVHP